MGGTTAQPTYHAMGDHTEALRLEFDASVVSYADLLGHFWTSVSPCAASSSRQYRHAIWTVGPEQHALAEASKAAVQEGHRARVTVSVEPVNAMGWTPAEDYHQKYYARHR